MRRMDIVKVLLCLIQGNVDTFVLHLVQAAHPVHLGECGYECTGHIACPLKVLGLLNADTGDTGLADEEFIGNSNNNSQVVDIVRFVAQEGKKVEQVLVGELVRVSSPLLFHKLEGTYRILLVGICLGHGYGYTQRVFLVESQGLLCIFDAFVGILAL